MQTIGKIPLTEGKDQIESNVKAPLAYSMISYIFDQQQTDQLSGIMQMT